MRLDNVVNEYVSSRFLEASTEFGYREAVRSFGEFLGKSATIDDIEPEAVNRWLQWFRVRGRKPHTIANRRRHLLVIARFAIDRGYRLALDERRIVKVKLPPTAKRVWSPEEVARIVRAIERLEDRAMRPCGVRRRAWWRSLILTAWDTALRWSDLSRLRRQDIRPDSSIDLVQHKTGIEHRVRLRPETFAAIDETFAGIAGTRELVWPCESPTWRHKEFRKIVELAGLSGTFGQLRRSSILSVERLRPGGGMMHAGHTKPETTVRWYLPRRELLDLAPQPEPIPMDRQQKPKSGSRVQRVKPGKPLRVTSPKGESIELELGKDDAGNWRLLIPAGSGWEFETVKPSA